MSLKGLTETEAQVLEALACGWSQERIAAERRVPVWRVTRALRSAYVKLKADTALEAVATLGSPDVEGLEMRRLRLRVEYLEYLLELEQEWPLRPAQMAYVAMFDRLLRDRGDVRLARRRRQEMRYAFGLVCIELGRRFPTRGGQRVGSYDGLRELLPAIDVI